jgi:hypothetical protein
MNIVQKIKESNFKIFEFDSKMNDIETLSLQHVFEFNSIFCDNSRIEFLPESVENMIGSLNVKHDFWPLLIPKQIRDTIVQTQTDLFNNNLENKQGIKYFSTWHKIRKFLDSFTNVTVDLQKWKEFTQTHGLNERILKGNFLEPIHYSTCGTTTGRLTITSGPNFLTMQKDFQSCLQSSDDDHCLIYLDFSSLEPRTILMSSKISFESDIYESIAMQLNLNTREEAKLATISALYGASAHKLTETVGSKKIAQCLISDVRKFFNVQDLEKRLNDQCALGMIQNYFGRPLFEAMKHERLRVNHYSQSSGIDVANLCFAKMNETYEWFDPKIAIHDAIIAEIPKDKLDKFVLDNQKIVFEDYVFPTKITML